MKYKTSVFNFPSSPPLNTFFSFFWVNPRRSRPCEPIKRTVPSHLPPGASQQSQLHHSILDYVQPFQSWVAGFCKDSCWAPGTFGGGEKCEVGCSILLLLFLLKENSCDLHMEDEVNKSYGAQHHSAASIQMYFPHHQCRRHLNPPSPQAQFPTARGEAGSLHALFTWPNAAILSNKRREIQVPWLGQHSITGYRTQHFQVSATSVWIRQTGSVNLWEASILRFSGRSICIWADAELAHGTVDLL